MLPHPLPCSLRQTVSIGGQGTLCVHPELGGALAVPFDHAQDLHAGGRRTSKGSTSTTSAGSWTSASWSPTETTPSRKGTLSGRAAWGLERAGGFDPSDDRPMTRLHDDPFEDRRDSSRQISQVTRRDIFDYIRTDGGPWHGRTDELGFLGRLYDLEALPSTDARFRTASRDIFQHRVNNDDWPDDWVFTDSRFQLASGPDEVLLGFLAQMVHPVVQPDTERAAKIVTELNGLLAQDGWMLKEHKQMSGRPVYAPARTGTGAGPAVEFAHEVATRIDAEYISRQVTRMEGAVDSDPDLAIGTAKEFVESICKTILDERQESYDKNDDLPILVRKTTKVLQLTPEDIDHKARGADTVKRMLMNLTTLIQGSAELRNAFGTGHGVSKTRARQRLTARQRPACRRQRRNARGSSCTRRTKRASRTSSQGA